MSRPVGNRSKDTIRREIAVKRAADLLARQTDTVYALDALAVLQEVMGHFYYKAKVLKTLGRRRRIRSDRRCDGKGWSVGQGDLRVQARQDPGDAAC